MAKKPAKTNRPLGLILPAIVFGLGIAAMWIGVPKELAVRRLTSHGVQVAGHVLAIEHQKNKQILNLNYEVNGQDHTLVSEQNDSSIPAGGHPNTEITYVSDDPSVATADLAGDSRLANEYLIAGALELLVGGWFTFAALRQRRRALMKAIADKNARSGV